MQSGPDQMKLLELQQKDTRLGQLRLARTQHPTIAKVAQVQGRLAALDQALVEARTATADLQREVDKLSGFISEATNRVSRNQARIDAGEVGPKDVMAVSEEMSTLVSRISQLEEEQLVVLESHEACLAAEEQIITARKQVGDELAGAEFARDQALAEVMAEGRQLLTERGAIAEGIPAGLLGKYEGLRKRIGSGAARYWGGKCEGCGLVLPPLDQERVVQAAPDQVVTCEECGRILVRVS
jgi:predicted  nucleic acid-binding Zn-ribbon protein